ncbi:MAG: type II toxin-antitoxin system RelE/ParE family toxin [Gammaproteobacteria bacterium]
MKIEFLDEAQIELDEAIEYYNNEVEGLGETFLEEVLHAIDRIARFPKAWHPLSKNTRRCQTRRFPYGLIYTVFDDFALVISVSNLHRKPNHWKDRIK